MSFTEMNHEENINFPRHELDYFEKLINEFSSQTILNQTLVNQIINSIFSIDHSEVLNYQKFFISLLTNSPQNEHKIVLSSEILTLIAIALSSFQILYLDRPIHDSFIQNWIKFADKNEIDINDLIKLNIIFHQLIYINDILEKQLITLASTIIHFLEIDCLSNKFPVSIISYILNTFNIFFVKFPSCELKRKVISICYHYIHITFQPIKMIAAANFLIQNFDQYDECLQFLTQSLQNKQICHEDSLSKAFSTISNKLYLNLKYCSPWSIYDSFSIISSFSISDSQIKTTEKQVNALLALNFFGVEKKINNEMDYFHSAINLLSNEKEEVPLLQLCESFRFSPIISIRNYQIFTIFFIYSIKTETFLIKMDDKSTTEEQVLSMMESLGRNFEYFKSIVDSILFFNHEIENGMFNVTIEMKKPIMNQFIQTMKLFLKFIIKFASKYEAEKEECSDYDDDCHLLLQKFGQKCKNIIFIKKAWKIANYTSRRIFEFLNIFPSNLLSVIYSIYTDLLLTEKANQLYVDVIVSFFPNMNNFLYFLEAFYTQTLKKIKNREFIKNAIIFIKWTNQLLTKNPQKVFSNELFVSSTKNFFIQFFKFTFSTGYTISLHSSLIKQLIKMINKMFEQSILLKIIPVEILVHLYISVPSVNKDNKYLNLLLIQLFPSHKSVLLNFEWYHKILLKHAILKPKIAIPAIKENNLIYDYKNTPEFQKFASDLLVIFDTFSSNVLRKLILEMLSYIPAKYTTCKAPQIVDISHHFVTAIISNDKMLIINGRQLIKYVREIITSQKPENKFEEFVNFINFHSIKKSKKEENSQKIVQIENSGGLLEIFRFLGFLANSIIEKCEQLQQFLLVQDIFALIIQYATDIPNCLPSNLTPSFTAHFIVSLAMNHYSFSENYDINLALNDSPEYFSDILSEAELVLYNVSYPSYFHATYVCKYLIEHFSKSSIDFLQLTKFVLNFILRLINDQLLPSHHIQTDENVKFQICHYLPKDVFEIVIFLKENVYNYNVIDFLPLFSVKLPFIACFSLCEIISKCEKEAVKKTEENDLFGDEEQKSIDDYLEDFAEIDLTQIVPLLLLFPEYQEKYVNLCAESLKIFNPKNHQNNSKIPFIFCLLDLPQNVFKNFFDVLKSCFIESSSLNSILIAECLKKACSICHLDSKKKSPLSLFVKQVLTDNGFYNDYFINYDLNSFKYLFSLFDIQPSLVVSVIYDQLNMLQQKKYKNSYLIDVNFKYLLNFLSLPSVINYLVENNEYKKIGKVLLTIYYMFSFDVSESMISYFSFKPKIWSKFISKKITNDEYVFFFFENIYSEQLSQIIIEIKDNIELLSQHLQNEFVQFFAIENSEITYNQIKESFMSYFTQKDRHFLQKSISYLVDNGEIWDLIISFLKSDKNYLIQALKLEIMKNDNRDFESLPNFIKNIQKEKYFSSFCDFFFECYHDCVDNELLQSITENIECNRLPVFERILQKHSINFEIDFESIYNNQNNNVNSENEYENNLLCFRLHDIAKIHSILDKIDLDSPSYIFEEFEKLVLDVDQQVIRTLMTRFIHKRKHFCSILKHIETNKQKFQENIFEIFSNELILFVSLNLIQTTEKNIVSNVDCFNVLCSFLPDSNQLNSTHFLWGKKLSEIANSILPIFVKDDNFFHKKYPEFNANLVLLVSLFGSQCKFIKTYFGTISKYYYENNSLILQELFECVPELVSKLDKLSETDLNPFVSLLCEMVNSGKNLTFPNALRALNILYQKGFGNIKKIVIPLSLIVKGELNEVPLSKLTFSADYTFANSFKNVFSRWILKGMDCEAFSEALEKVEQKSDLSNWLLFARSQISDDFIFNFKSGKQFSNFFSQMPFEIIRKYRKFIVDESSVPLYYYKQLSFYPEEKSSEKNPIKNFLLKEKEEKGKFKSFFKLFEIDYFYKHIIANTDNYILSIKSDSFDSSFFQNSSNLSFFSGVSSCIFPPDQNVKQNFNKTSSSSSSSSFQLFQDARSIIGIPKCYPNQIIERLCRAKDTSFMSIKSSEISQFLCFCSLCHNPIVPPYFSRYHPLKLFEDFNRLLQFATTKGINVDFTPLDKSEAFITQSQCRLNNDEKVSIMKTKENFLIYALKNNFSNQRIWSDLSPIENDDILYLSLHSNFLPVVAQKEILRQIKEFPFRWSQLLFEDIVKGTLHESFISLVQDVFRIDYSSIFSSLTSNEEVEKLRSKSFFETKIIDEEHPSHNFSFTVKPTNKFFSVLPVSAPLTSSNCPMHSCFLRIEQEDSSFGIVDVCLVDGTRIKYILTGMIDAFNPEYHILAKMINKILRKRLYCHSNHVELNSPQIQVITKSGTNNNESKLFLVKTNASPLLKKSVYHNLLDVKREGKYPPLKKFNQFAEFKSNKDFYLWQLSFLHRFAAFSYLHVGLGLRAPLPFHILVDESIASIEFLKLRKNSGENEAAIKIRVFGELIKFISPNLCVTVVPTAMMNMAMALKFAGERLGVVLKGLVGNGFSEKMEKFGRKLLEEDGERAVEQLIESSCKDVPINDIPWF